MSSNLQKRNSFSSGSANFSIGEKSGTVSMGDNASTKALAGSIAGYRYTSHVWWSCDHRVGLVGSDVVLDTKAF